MALLLAVYEPDTRRLRIADSGVPQPLLLRQGETQTIDVLGVPLGRLEDLTYNEEIVPLRPGDVLVFLSDGVEDCVDTQGLAFGREAVCRVSVPLVDRSAQEIANALVTATEEYCLGSEGELDDRTVVVIKAK